MGELVVIRQKSDFTTSFLAADPEAAGPPDPRPVTDLHELTPYGMLLAALGSCTAILLNSYAAARKIPLDAVELSVAYRRDARKDCANCEGDDVFDEGIDMRLRPLGKLSPAEREKLLAVSRHCPVEKILQGGIAVNSSLSEEDRGGGQAP